MNLLELASQYKDGVEILKDWLHDGAITVSPEQAQNRANVCIACPMNTHSGIVTESIAMAVRRQVEIKNHLNLRVDGEKKLGKCSACSCESRLKIWIPLRRIKPDEVELQNFDPKCWLRNECE